MNLLDAIRTTGAVREFTSDPVPDQTLRRILDSARFAPSGGNRQGWKVVVLRDPDARRRLRDLYLRGWYEYLAMSAAGLVPWSPLADRGAEARAVEGAGALAERAARGGGGFAEHLDRAPAVLVLLADLRVLAAVDRDLDRYTMAGGASIYPFAWNLLLAARAEGLAGVITTMALRTEAKVKELVGAPEEMALAAVIALGRPVHQPTRLRRAPVDSFTSVDRVDGPPLG